MASLRCPVCGKLFEPHQTTAPPFCSPRCRDIDLGRWLSEKHSVPSFPKDSEDPEGGQASPPTGVPPEGEDGS